MSAADRNVILPIMGMFFQGDEAERWERALRALQGDQQLRNEAGPWAPRLIEQIIMGKHRRAAQSAHGSLSLIIALDVLPRLLYRGQARAFAGDLAAQGTFLEAIAEHQDDAMTPLEKLYFFQPLVHAEDMSMQEQALTAYKRISLGTIDREHEIAEAFYSDAVDHHAIIHRFGRFPERNRIQGRRSTPEETVYLESTRRTWVDPLALAARATVLH